MFKVKFQQLLKERNISISKLAQETCVTKSVLSDWNCGKVLPKLTYAVLLANYFKVSLDYLFTETIENDYNPIKLNANFGLKLKQLLKQLEIKQKDLIENVKISKSDIHYWSKTSANPQMDTIIKIADYLQVSIDYLVGIE